MGKIKMGTQESMKELFLSKKDKVLEYWNEFLSIGEIIEKIQENLFIIQAELAGVPKSLGQCHIDSLEQTIEGFESEIANLHSFVIPGATELSALFDYTRAVSRRAERSVIAVRSGTLVSPETLAYLNRLSSFLYALARYSVVKEGKKEISPSYS